MWRILQPRPRTRGHPWGGGQHPAAPASLPQDAETQVDLGPTWITQGGLSSRDHSRASPMTLLPNEVRSQATGQDVATFLGEAHIGHGAVPGPRGPARGVVSHRTRTLTPAGLPSAALTGPGLRSWGRCPRGAPRAPVRPASLQLPGSFTEWLPRPPGRGPPLSHFCRVWKTGRGSPLVLKSGR